MNISHIQVIHDYGFSLADNRDTTRLQNLPTHISMEYKHLSDTIRQDVVLCLSQLILENDGIGLEQIASWLIHNYTFDSYQVFTGYTVGDSRYKAVMLPRTSVTLLPSFKAFVDNYPRHEILALRFTSLDWAKITREVMSDSPTPYLLIPKSTLWGYNIEIGDTSGVKLKSGEFVPFVKEPARPKPDASNIFG